jgi:hypothetical protein
MQVREAKDFLVQRTAEQAQMDNMPFSDLEKRMMYFTENEEMSEDPIKLNDEFEAEYDTDEYETKVSLLLHHAYARIKKENPKACNQWEEAIRTLSKGDHYLPVLWEREPSQKLLSPSSWKLSSPSFWKLLAIAILVLVILMIGFVAYLHYGDSKPSQPNAAHLAPINFSNSPSLKIVTPSSFAFSYFDPGSIPTTT